jgi:hypothetical protein
MNGGGSYDVVTVIANTAKNQTWITIASAIAFVGGFLQIIGLIWMGFKHKTHGMPLICTTWFLAHDSTYLLNYHHWFYETNFPLLANAWYTMAFYNICELVVLYQILRYSREEVFPQMSMWQAVLSCLGAIILCYAVFWWLMSLIRDPFNYNLFATTALLSPLFNIPMMRARGSRKGFALWPLIGVAMVPVGTWWWLYLSDPYFQQPFIVTVAIGNVIMGLIGVWYFLKLPEYHPEFHTNMKGQT